HLGSRLRQPRIAAVTLPDHEGESPLLTCLAPQAIPAMITRFHGSPAWRRAWVSAALAFLFAASMFGCGSLTNVDAPDVVQPAALNNPLGADAYTNPAF